MLPAKVIHSLLSANAGVEALVGTRIHPVARPQDGPLPAIVFSRNQNDEDYSIDGPAGDELTTVSIECWATTHDEADEVAAAVKKKVDSNGPLAGYRGSNSGIFVHAIRRTAGSDSYEQPQAGQEQGYFAVILEFAVKHQTQT